ncbi:hypothetical protein IMSHALPRED_010205 [Imshaugia aleurites]|uniref:Heterokaryon incompatibility domain-containing protein n=1 Tax=Imshaugia aleurites TaxID=172621 RepID=A0A8H3IZ00_9LECA|nr:hypothetical protein IMSHALPRED_010205 [Imshaugia aleurites]
MAFTFQHQRLESQRSIRLLTILPGKSNQHVHCTCMHVSLAAIENVHVYEAISYTWGNPARTHDITINGCPFPVPNSAHDVLQHLRYEDKTRQVWLDAICINQNDDDEKGCQVALMREIYASATQVVAWLGNPSEDSALAFQFMKQLKVLYEACTSELGEPVPPYPSGNWGISVVGVLDWTQTTLGSRQWKALRSLLKRPWFRRIWVFQEVVVAKRVFLSCGHCSIDFQDFAPIIHWMMYCEAHIILHHRDEPTERGHLDSDRSTSGLTNLSKMHETRYNLNFEHKLVRLEDHLCEPVSWEASDPRDWVYGVLGILEEVNGTALAPDYRKGTADVYVTVTRLAILTNRSLRVLLRAGVDCARQVSDLPSWVPDFTMPLQPPAVGLMDDRSSRALKTPPMSASFQGNKLMVRAIKVGAIRSMGPVYSPAPRNGQDWVGQNKELFTWLRVSLATLGPVSTDMLWETLIHSIFERTGEIFHAGYESWKTLSTYKCSRRFSWAHMRSALKIIWRLPEKLGEAGRYQETMLIKSVNMRLAGISSGGLGMVPAGARVGDPIYILYGMSVPIVLRERIRRGDTEKSFAVVKGCYVQKLPRSIENLASREEEITLE